MELTGLSNATTSNATTRTKPSRAARIGAPSVTGPLSGVRIVELAGLGPAPFAGMMLADAGADVIRVDRSGDVAPAVTPKFDLLNRGRRSVAVDLKHPSGVDLVLQLVSRADGLIEGFRPGVAERLGVGPAACLARNPALVYGRMTGWGQSGPLATAAGHDIDYIALSGALESIGRVGDRPVPPLNLVGDFGGGGMMLAFGMVAAILHARESGDGQIVDAAMVDGAALLMTGTDSLKASGLWGGPRGTNVLDSGAHFYEVYETSDHRFVAVGAIEPQFYAALIRLMGLSDHDLPRQMDQKTWPAMKARFVEVFATKTRDEWTAIFDKTDACVAPVLTTEEAHAHSHNAHRATFTEVDGIVQAAPAPRFSGTPGSIQRPPPNPGQHTDEALEDWGIDRSAVQTLRESGALS
jgi:alpha-methylacyl-CoA racemase